MTQEEKLEEAKRLYKTANADQRYILESLFHELKESEGENIRRWIINYLDNKAINSGIIQEKTNIKNAIDWLEKQGEQKSIEYPLCKTVKDKIDYYIVNHFTTDTVVKTDVNSIVKAMEEGVRLGMKEQNPAWSEEDEKIIFKMMFAFTTRVFPSSEECGSFIDFLKSLKPTWKPSDEQIEALDKVYKTHGANNVCRRVLFNLMNDLKKLKG